VAAVAATANVIQVSDLRFGRAGRVVFDGLNLSVERGTVTAIMGPSGTGKTTLLRMVTGQLRPKSGRVVVQGHDIATLSRAALFRLRRSMGMLFQNGALLTDYSVFENVAFPLREHTRLPERLIRSIVLMKLQAVGLRGAAQLMPSQLSGGMARRIALARAMVMDPDLILYDEPFSGLDPIAMGAVMRLIRLTNDALGLTSVIVTHDVREVSQIADYCYVISGGSVIGAGTPQELGQTSSNLIQQFMNGEADGPVPFHYPAPDYTEQLLSSS
jgi:phospholipid/cholesterol/gamma-HCH transport system ATP-binding protein